MKNISTTLRQIQNKYGEGSIMVLGEENLKPVPTTSSGVIALDLALSGGIPDGRVIEMYGPPMSGKSSVALFHIAEAQKSRPDRTTAYIDMEQSLDPQLAQAYGVDLSNMLIAQPSTGEEALDIAEALTRSEGVSTIVIDSVAALLPAAEDEADMAQNSIGLQARMMSKALRKLNPIAAETGTTLIFINQIREKVGAYGNPEITSGGRALGFFASVRIELRAGEPINEKGVRIGHEVRCRISKNKVAPPYRTCTFKLMYGKGVDRYAELVDIGIQSEVIHQAGSWLSYEYKGETIKLQGREKFADYLRENEGVCNEINAIIRGEKPLEEETEEEVEEVEEENVE